ncbi:MAG: serine/threonine protein phosphatase [Gammaproteobacteria bacterium]|nr:serine/threonine protein phosphatase [Gammaproteobacteria bacterium]|tara:strand:- start:3321 stop:4865 length:1545 start_codon:yes stop_codon:yes gene_type:complete
MIRLALASLLLFACFSNAQESSKKEIVLLHTNDIESVYEPIPATWRDDMELIGGISHLATLIRDVRESEDISFLVDAGDIFTGALSKKSEGKLPFDLYSAMNYDTLTLGNHEFEYGWERLVETIPRANFPVLNANIVHQESGELIAQPYTILNRNGVKVGVIGVMGIDAFYNTMASFHRTGLTIKDPTETAQYWADIIRDEVNIIVVLTHQNRTAPMQTNKESDPSVQRGFDEDYAMAGNLKGVDVIFGGHSDNGLQEPVIHPDTGTVIGLTFGQGMHLGYTKFKIDTQKHDVEFIEGYLIPVNSKQLLEDKQTATLIKDYRKIYPELLEVLAVVSEPLMRKYNEESSIGNLLTDYMREAAQSDIAFLNSGAIRADFNAGDVTLEQLINVYPFKDNLTIIELTGNQIKELVEYSLTLPYGIGQISGLQINYDSTQDMMNRVIDIKVNGNELIDNKKYTVSVSGYLAKGGDGYRVFPEGRFISDDKPFQDALYEEFKKAKIIESPAPGRLIDISN